MRSTSDQWSEENCTGSNIFSLGGKAAHARRRDVMIFFSQPTTAAATTAELGQSRRARDETVGPGDASFPAKPFARPGPDVFASS
jgi:hypothetical protein